MRPSVQLVSAKSSQGFVTPTRLQHDSHGRLMPAMGAGGWEEVYVCIVECESACWHDCHLQYLEAANACRHPYTHRHCALPVPPCFAVSHVCIAIWHETESPATLYLSTGNQALWLRYAEWLLSCPVILIHLSNLTGKAPGLCDSRLWKHVSLLHGMDK
jgi:hypothetical protein